MEVLAASPDRHTRRKLAGQTGLAPHLIDALATDEDRRIRLAIARRSDCPLVTLQRLEHDDDAVIRAAAGSGLSAALAPRALAISDAGGLFTAAELEAIEDAPTGVVPLPEETEPAVEPPSIGAGANEVLRRLDAISRRLTVIEARLAPESGRLPPAARRTHKAVPAEEDAQPHLPGLWDQPAVRHPEADPGRWEPPPARRPDADGARRLHTRRS